jgi:hypothetical protein
VSSHTHRIAARRDEDHLDIEFDNLHCQQGARLMDIIDRLGIEPEGPIPLWERFLLVWMLCRAYQHLPLPGCEASP